MKENEWNPNYLEIFAWRQRQLFALYNNPNLIAGAKEFYRTRPAEFINHWCDTYDPRNAGGDKPAFMPFILFKRQIELVTFLSELIEDKECGMVEKARDMGATWVCCAFSIWLWLFKDGSSVGWGSRKSDYVHRLGDPDSIFEKIGMIFKTLPPFFIPEGFDPKKHMSFMKIINPENKATITGESGDNIGRGGRKLIYFKDESAHYERPEKIEASLSDNTNIQVDISSVNGIGNVFYKKRMAGEIWQQGKKTHPNKTRVFIMDWRDHPMKDQAWYDARRSKAQSEGMIHLFSQEVDRNYAASVVGVVIPQEWVNSSIDAHKKLGFEPEGLKFSALDVADEEGTDTNAQSVRHGVVLIHAEQWAGIDTTKTARNAIGICEQWGVDEFYYDCIGVGAGVRGETNSIQENRKQKLRFKIHPWNAAASGKSLPKAEKRIIPKDQKSPLIKDFYASLKSMAWWEMRQRFEKTHRAVTKGEKYNHDELVSIDSNIENLHVIKEQLSQSTWKKSDSTGKIIINKTANGSTSPNIADSIIMAYRPPSIRTQFKIM